MTDLSVRAHAVLADGETVVLVRHVDNGSVWYEAPGVSVRPDETPGLAAARAAAEQLGIEVEIGGLAYADTERGVEHYFFLAAPVAGGSELLPTASDDGHLVALRRAALLAYRVEPPQLARLLTPSGTQR
jgi:ADP-ribose pyrophosphatase YjhB (NUDIX family)